MDINLFIQMIKDRQFSNLKKMQHKYTKLQVEEMILGLKKIGYKDINLRDFDNRKCVYLPANISIDTVLVKKLLKANNTSKHYVLKAMEDEIEFANHDDDVPEPIKACILHFFMAYIHPYFDGNGRTARLLHLWYLIQKARRIYLYFPDFSLNILLTSTNITKISQKLNSLILV